MYAQYHQTEFTMATQYNSSSLPPRQDVIRIQACLGLFREHGVACGSTGPPGAPEAYQADLNSILWPSLQIICSLLEADREVLKKSKGENND